MILVSYDGSVDAQAAIARAALIAPGAEATILTAWEPFVIGAASSGDEGMGVGLAGVFVDDHGIDVANEDRDGYAGEVLEEDSRDVDLLVAGSRGHGPLGAVLAGSATAILAGRSSGPLLVLPRGAHFDLLAQSDEAAGDGAASVIARSASRISHGGRCCSAVVASPS